MTREFCTYFDSRYLVRGLALAGSIARHCPDYRLWVLCLDEACYATLQRLDLPCIVPLRLEDFEADDAELQAAKGNRTRIEYYFTCTPSLPLYIFRQAADCRQLTYLDADLFFFSSPEPIFEEIGSASIGIVPHRFPPAMRRWEEYGLYNVGWLTFRRDPSGLSALGWWRQQCLEWCYDRLEGGRFAEQKYLDDWPRRFANVHVIEAKGADVASWNLANYTMTRRHGEVHVDDEALIFFHFHHLRRQRRWLLETDFAIHDVKPCRVFKDDVLAPYCRALDEHAETVAPLLPGIADGASIRASVNKAATPLLSAIRHLAAGQWLFYIGGRVC
jgi:hypothetical protein